MCWGKLFLQGMPNMDDRSERYFGNYQLIRRLGQGSFADVYLAKHIHLDTQAAIKVLKLNLTSDNVEHFRTEARTIAHLIHPHIVRVLDFGIEGRTPFLVMDYAPNGTLRKRHPKGTRLPLETVVNYTKQVAEALQYAHEKRLIHRDIKPENMLLGEHYEILLSDFGIATITQSTHYQNIQEISGTVAYMAPEQLQGKPRRASDQYSLGIVVYEWLCGDRPFHGSFTEIYSQHMFTPPPSLDEKLPELPPAIEEVVLIALAKDPKERFATIQAFATALEKACQAAPRRPIALLPGLPSPSQPLPPTDTVAASPSSQVSKPSLAAPSSSPPTEALSATSLAGSFSASNLPNDGNACHMPKTRSNSAIANRRQGFHRPRVALLVGLALLILIGSLGFYNVIRTRTGQITISYADATATAQTKAANAVATLVQANYATATTQAIVAATVTAAIAYNNY